MTAVISCQQLLTADDSSWKLIKMKINLESWNLAHISLLGCRWKFHLNFFPASCHQLSTAVESWWKLIIMKINLDSWNLAHISPLGYKWKSHYFFGTAIISFVCNSCHQLLTTDDSENQHGELKFWTYITFRVVMKIPFNFFCDSFHQLSTAIDSLWQLMTMKISQES